MIFCVIGELRMEVPTRASQPFAITATSASLSPWGVSQDALPRITSQPLASNSLWVSPVGSAGAKTNTLPSAMFHSPLMNPHHPGQNRCAFPQEGQALEGEAVGPIKNSSRVSTL